MDQDERFCELMARVAAGDARAYGDLVRSLQEDMMRLAGELLGEFPGGPRLEPEELVVDAFLRLRDLRHVRGRDSFLEVARSAMRVRLEDDRRVRGARGPGAERELLVPERLQEALRSLHRAFPDGSQLFYLTVVLGMSLPEAARDLGISDRTVERRWRAVRSLLRDRLNGRAEES